MDFSISTLKLTGALARHAGHAHAAVSDNLARADIPRAERMAVQPFEEMVRFGRDTPALRAAGEGIAVENEMLSLADAGAQHQAAIGLWQSTLSMLRVAVAAPR